MRSKKIKINNIPIGLDVEDLKNFFESNLFDKNVIGIKQEQKNSYDSKDVIIEFGNEQEAKDIISKGENQEIIYTHEETEYILKPKMYYEITKAKGYYSDSESVSSTSSFNSSNDLECLNNPAMNRFFKRTFYAYHSRNFWGYTLQLIKHLNKKYSPDVQIHLANNNNDNKSKRVFEMISKDLRIIDECFQELKSRTKVISEKFDLGHDEFGQVIKLKKQLMSLIPANCQKFVYFWFDEKNSLFFLEYLDIRNDLRKEFENFLNQIRKFLDENIEKIGEFSLLDSSYIKFFEKYFISSESFKIEIINQTLRLKAKKSDFEKFKIVVENLNKIDRKVNFKRNFISFLNSKLNDFIRDLESNRMLLVYKPLNRDSNFFEFSIVSANREMALTKAHSIINFIEKNLC